MHIFPNMGADQHKAIGIADIRRLRRAYTRSEGGSEADLTRPAALGIGRGNDICGSISFEQVADIMA